MALGLTKETISSRLEAGLCQLLDNGHLALKGDDVMDVLESVPGADLDQFYVFRQIHREKLLSMFAD